MAFFFRRKKRSAVDFSNFEIPSFSSSVIGLLGKLRNPDIDVKEIAADLEHDPGLYLRVLKTVNAASFGLSRKVSNIQLAVNLLGRSRMESLVLTVAVKNNLSEHCHGNGLDMGAFWTTAALRAAVAKSLAEELHPHSQNDIFTVALLQDMAIPLLALQHGERYQTLYNSWVNEDDINLPEQEDQLFGSDHMSLGAHMAQTWEFSPTLVNAIGEHHDQQSKELPLALKIAAWVNTGPQTLNRERMAQQAAQIFGLDHKRLIISIDQAFEQSSELAAALN